MKAKILDWLGFSSPKSEGSHDHLNNAHGYTHGVIDATIATTAKGTHATRRDAAHSFFRQPQKSKVYTLPFCGQTVQALNNQAAYRVSFLIFNINAYTRFGDV